MVRTIYSPVIVPVLSPVMMEAKPIEVPHRYGTGDKHKKS